MKKLTLRDYVPVFSLAIILVIALTILTSGLALRFDTDYAAVVPMVKFAIRAVTEPSKYLAWNPYIGLGIPVIGDPSSIITSPWYMPVFLLFGADVGIRILIALMIVVSGFTMWLFLSSLKINSKVAAWGAMLYETSGALTALVTSARLERFGSFAVSPYIFYLFLNDTMSVSQMAVIGLLYACMYLSTDIYTPWLISILYVAVSLYKVYKKHLTVQRFGLELAVIYGSFVVFASPRLLPFLLYVRPHFARPWLVNAFSGSVHAWLLPLMYMVPLRVSFYDRPFFQRLLGFYYNWYEYYAFISPLPFVFLLAIRRVLKNKIIQYSLIIILTGALYLALKYPYSPFYWIFHIFTFVQAFRVPQRMVGIMLAPVIAVICICADSVFKRVTGWRRKSLYILCIVTVVWTGINALQTMKDGFEPFRKTEYAIAHELRKRDPSSYFVLDLRCCIQPFLSDESIPIINYYYGWLPTYTPKFTDITGNSFDPSRLSITKPSYIIADTGQRFEKYGYSVYFERGGIRVWKAKQPTIFPNL